jgi:hypothetical protein
VGVELAIVFTCVSLMAVAVKSVKAISDIHVRFDRLEQEIAHTSQTVGVIEKELLRRNYL